MFKGLLYHASANTETKGILIGISAQLDFTINKGERKDGSYVIVQGTLAKKHLLLINVCAPNDKQKHFYWRLVDVLGRFVETEMRIMAGDFNGLGCKR